MGILEFVELLGHGFALSVRLVQNLVITVIAVAVLWLLSWYCISLVTAVMQISLTRGARGGTIAISIDERLAKSREEPILLRAPLVSTMIGLIAGIFMVNDTISTDAWWALYCLSFMYAIYLLVRYWRDGSKIRKSILSGALTCS